MKEKTEKKRSFSFSKKSRLPSIMRKKDKQTAILFIVLFVASIVAYYIMMKDYGFTIYTGLPVMASPFFVIGLIFYIVNRRYIAGAFIAGVSIAAYFLMPSSVLFILYLLVCTEGVAMMVEIIQRKMFFGIMDVAEHVNLKDKLTFRDRLVVFMFSIPVDLDTRKLTIDRNILRNKLPWKDMFFTMMLALLFCMFLWIYVFLNPTITLETNGVPIYTFTIILYLSVIVMPWNIFSTVNARITSEYRDFKLYSGLLDTFKRMFIPAFAAILFLVFSIATRPDDLYYVCMSLAMIAVMIVFTSVMYYTSNETSVVNDVLDGWDEFQPTDVYSRYEEGHTVSSLDDDVPGTPRRDPSECFSPELRGHYR